MRWEDERYVRVYTRDTGEWLALGWEAQALFLLLLRKADRAGLVHSGKAGVRGLAALAGMPIEVVQRAAPLLLEDGCLRESVGGYVIPNFMAAQEARASDAQRKRDQRERDRDKAIASGASGSSSGLDAEAQIVRSASRHVVTHDGHNLESQVVTSGHAGKVTPSLAVPSRAEPLTTLSDGSDEPEDLPDATDDAEPVPQAVLFAVAVPPEKPKKKPAPDPETLRTVWNRVAPPLGFQVWEAMGDDRKRDARLALEAVPDLAKWEAWLRYELARPWNRGENDDGWKANVEWLLRKKTRNLVADFNPATTPKPPASVATPKPTKFVEM